MSTTPPPPQAPWWFPEVDRVLLILSICAWFAIIVGIGGSILLSFHPHPVLQIVGAIGAFSSIILAAILSGIRQIIRLQRIHIETLEQIAPTA